VTCPWHEWKYSVIDGKAPHEGGDSVSSYETKVRANVYNILLHYFYFHLSV
jgi:nitrite reductase/ring-hydroxylating ferredoxin subunit